MKKTNLHHAVKRILIFILLLPQLLTAIGQEIVPPKCYGGNRMTREFIQEEMIYPSKALESRTEGNVVVSCIVNPDATVTDVHVQQKVSPELDKEAIRLFNKILWFPATELGKPVPYRHKFELKFRISKYQKLIKQRGYEYFAYPHEPIDSGNAIYYRKDIDQSPRPVFSILEKDFQTFLINNLEYPEAAFKQNIAGVVRLKFVVEPSGRISNILAEKTVGGGCTEEAIRVAKLIKWMPGINENMAVRTFMPLEIRFDIAKKSVGGSIPSPGQLQ